MTWQNLPVKAKALRQWIIWKLEVAADGKEAKPPYHVSGRYKINPLDPANWVSFGEAVAAAQRLGLSGYAGGIGFVLTEADPFSIIDLDDKISNPASPQDLEKFGRIIRHLASFTEVSVSGRGIHVWVEGALPSSVKSGHLEVYSKDRYMACSGVLVAGYPTEPQPRQEDLIALHAAFSAPATATCGYQSPPERMTDEQILVMASSAANGEKFLTLYGPDWASLGYPSGSEAEYGLLSQLCFYSPNNDQVYRLFRRSELGQRKQSHDKRVLDAIGKIRSRMPPPIPPELIEAGVAAAKQMQVNQKENQT